MGARIKRKNKSDLLLIDNNNKAIVEGPQKKSWTKHDVRAIKPLTDNQHEMFRAYYEGSHVCAYGSAGTGKTFLAVFLAMCDVLDGNHPQNHLIIVRSAVATRDIGFLPGTLEEKICMYEQPYKDILADLFRRVTTYEDMKEAGIVRFVPTSFIRGLTWDNAIIIIDEGQNLTFHEINSIMTRVGENTRVIFTGDLNQTDLNKSSREKSGMERFIATAEHMKEFSLVKFNTDDIIRSDFVRSWIIATEKSE